MIEFLPTSVEIDGNTYNIRNKCDYRVVLDVISALNDPELEEQDKIKCALFIFYESVEKITNHEKAFVKMMEIINNGETVDNTEEEKPQYMSWEKDFKIVVAPINRILGYEVRSVEYLHWWSFLSAYMEIGECFFATVVSIRKKRRTGKTLEGWEKEFYKENRKVIDLPNNLTQDEIEWLENDY